MGLVRVAAITFFLVAVASLNLADEVFIPCGENEQMGNCGRSCEGTCQNPELSQCPATICENEGCRCKPGFLRNEETDMCVQDSMCPRKSTFSRQKREKKRKEKEDTKGKKKKEKCKRGETLLPCGSACEGTCQNPETPERCKTMFCSKPSCGCDLSKEYVRNSRVGACVKKYKCPRYKNDQND